MYQEIIEMLKNWNKTHDRQARLQHAYFASAVLVLMIAGLVGLINYSLGQSLLFVAVSLFIIFIANTIAWALLESIVLSKISSSKRVGRK